MSEDNGNVTTIPEKTGQNQTPESLIKSIEAEFQKELSEAFKKQVRELMKQKREAERIVLAKDAEIKALVTRFKQGLV